MGYNSRFEGTLTPSKPIPSELVEIINGMDLDVRVITGGVTAAYCDGDYGDIAPWSSNMHGYYLKEDISRVQRLLDEQKTGITLSGEILREGDASGDFEKIEVVKGKVYTRAGEVVYGKRQKVTLDRWAVRVLTRFKRWPKEWKTCGWVVTAGCLEQSSVAWSRSDEVPHVAERFASENDARTAARAHTDKTHRCEVVKTEVLR